LNLRLLRFPCGLIQALKDFDGDKVSDWMEVINVFKAHGWEAGIDWKFKDAPHLQKLHGYQWPALLDKYNKKDFIKGSTYVNL
jgi:hypothetical protein